MGLSLNSFLPYRLSRLSEAVSLEIRPVYRDTFGLNRPDWRVLVALADIGPATATRLGQHCTLHKTKVSRAVRALEERRWLKRETDASDRRFEILTMTPAGQRAYCELVGPMRTREGDMLDQMPAEDREALERGLRSLEGVLGIRTAEQG